MKRFVIFAKAKILAISILYGILLIITALPGAWFWNRAKHHRQSLSKETA